MKRITHDVVGRYAHMLSALYLEDNLDVAPDAECRLRGSRKLVAVDAHVAVLERRVALLDL